MREDTRKEGLLGDQRGAIMLVGLFMACGLIASMWFMVGVGDSIVYHQRMQEASDHAVFSDAVVHARGMNLISAINLVMYMITAIYLVLCVVLSILEAADIVLSAACLTVVASVWACPADAACLDLSDIVFDAKEVYEDTAVDVGLPACATIQTIAAIGYPWYGEYASYSIGDSYGRTSLSFSPSMIPGNAVTSGGFSQYGNFQKAPPTTGLGSSIVGGDTKLGLPVTNQKMNNLCKWVGADVVTALIPGPAKHFMQWANSFLGNLIGSALAALYCTGFPWDSSNGPKSMWGQAKNGNDWMQVWTYTFTNNWGDPSERKVTLGQGTKTGLNGADTSAPPMGYYAESEFYFDCSSTWSDESCNGQDLYSQALFHMDWRARLRRVHMPNLLGDLMSFAGQFVLNTASNYISNGALQSSAFGQWVQKQTGASNQLFSFAASQVSNQVTGFGKTGLGKLTGSFSGVAASSQIIH